MGSWNIPQLGGRELTINLHCSGGAWPGGSLRPPSCDGSGRCLSCEQHDSGPVLAPPGPSIPADTIFNVIFYGAKGDGFTDDTAAVQQTINRASAVGGTVLFPSGHRFYLTSGLTVSGNGTTLTGSRANVPTPSTLSTQDASLIWQGAPDYDLIQTNGNNLGIHNLNLTCETSATAGWMIDTNNFSGSSSGFNMSNVNFSHMYQGVQLNSVTGYAIKEISTMDCAARVLQFNSSSWGVFSNSIIQAGNGTDYTLYINAGSSHDINNNTIGTAGTPVYVPSQAVIGVIGSASNTQIDNNTISIRTSAATACAGLFWNSTVSGVGVSSYGNQFTDNLFLPFTNTVVQADVTTWPTTPPVPIIRPIIAMGPNVPTAGNLFYRLNTPIPPLTFP